MTIGTTYPPELTTYTDSQTGRRVTQLTNSNAKDYHLYFYNPTVTPDNQYLIFISERTGISNLFRLDLNTGEIVQLTDAAPARADYFPFTYTPIHGVSACLPAIGAHEVFYFVGNTLFGVNYETLATRPLLQLPPDRRPSMLNADASGTTLVFATWDEARFAEWERRMVASEVRSDDQTFQQTTSTIIRYDTTTEQCDEILRLDHFWINHVLLHPTNRDLILFCHEYSSQPDRMWLLDASTGEYAPIPGQDADEWYEHEFWSKDGTRVCFHGGVENDKTIGFCGWYNITTNQSEKFYHCTPGRTYAHYNLSPDGKTMLTDGEGKPGCISQVHLQNNAQKFEPLCRHDSYKYDDDQRCHPHPSFTPDGTQVIFTSNRTGTSNIYLTDWS